MLWKTRIKDLLMNSWRYAFKPPYPVIDDAEWFGSEAEPGFLDSVYSAVNYERRMAFFQGYAAGAADACHDLGREAEFNHDVSNIGAWRAWEAAEK